MVLPPVQLKMFPHTDGEVHINSTTIYTAAQADTDFDFVDHFVLQSVRTQKEALSG